MNNIIFPLHNFISYEVEKSIYKNDRKSHWMLRN